MPFNNILIFDVDYRFSKKMNDWLVQYGYGVRFTSEMRICKSLLNSGTYKIVVICVRYMDCDGMRLIDWIAKQNSGIRFAFTMDCDNNALTAHAFKNGASEYIDKRTLSVNAFLGIIRGMQAKCNDGNPEYSYRSEEYNNCIQKASMAYAHKDILLLNGETGSGKSHIAKRIHQYGSRHNHSFIQIKCTLLDERTSIPHLFGTSIHNNRNTQGIFSNVGRGTLFFDEIEKLPMNAQSMLAHVIEEGHFHVGASSVLRSFHGKIIVSTSDDLYARVGNGTFRRDLYDLISHNIVKVPPLRLCRKDIVPFAEFFLSESARELKTQPKRLSEGAKRHMLSHQWIGNIRELRSVMSFADAECDSSVIKTSHLHIRALSTSLECREQQSIREALALADNNKTIASRLLGISRPTLYARMSKLNL